MSCIHGSICFLRVLTLTTSLNTQLNFIFCMLTRLLRELCFVPLTGVQHHSSGFIYCQNAHWEPDDEASNRSDAPAKLRSDNRWVVPLSGTSHWYSNLLHFPRERTPQWKHYCPPPGFDPTGMKQVAAETWRRQLWAAEDQTWGSSLGLKF